jgi:hydrogenase/urease accessory protein HupE
MSRTCLKAVAAASLAVVVLAASAAAHPLAPSLLEVRERGGGRVDVTWKTTLLQPAGSNLRPELPPHCLDVTEPVAERNATSISVRWTADCGERGIVGQRLRVFGLETTRTDALIRVELADGRRLRAVRSGGDAAFDVPARQQPAGVALDYGRLGVEHILSGLDHLLFVLGLLLMVRGRRALLLTITAFTLGHSVTLSLAVLGFVDIPTAPVELAIAASILVLANELSRPGAGSLLQRRPALLTFVFGLLHGLGFAGALAAVGLPAEEIPLSLLAFNVGIELGQLAFIAIALGVRAALRTQVARGPFWLRDVPAYCIGSLAAFWCIERAAALFG